MASCRERLSALSGLILPILRSGSNFPRPQVLPSSRASVPNAPRAPLVPGESYLPGKSLLGLASGIAWQRSGLPSAFSKPLLPVNSSCQSVCTSVARLYPVALSRVCSLLVIDRYSYKYAGLDWRNAGGVLVGAFCGLFLGIDFLSQHNSSQPVKSEASHHRDDKEELLMPSLVVTRMAESFLEELEEICDKDRISSDPDDRSAHGKCWNTYHKLENIPDVVIYPKTTEEVVSIVKLCNKYKVPLTAYGAATSLEGQTLTPYGGASLDMTVMKSVKALHLDDMDVVVEPGIGWVDLNEYLKPYGLFFPLDPGPGATVGGMCATRCSGSLAVRYGTMRDNVISLKVVMANGDIVKTAARARKSSAGYDLTRLLIGSEGTLGVITEVTLRLQKIPEASTVAMCNFPSLRDAANVAIAIMHSGIQASRIELLDDRMIKAVNLGNSTSYPEATTLMFELIGTDAYALEQTELVQKIAKLHQASDFVYAVSPEEKEQLWKIRKEAFWSISTLKENAEIMTTDVCVPLSKLAECISTAKSQLDASPLTTCIVCHAGDGNFHAAILFDPGNENEVEEAQRLAKSLTLTALALEDWHSMKSKCNGLCGSSVPGGRAWT